MQNKLLNLYNAQKSKDGKRINLTLVRGESDAREYYTSSIELDNTKKSVQAQIKNGYVYIKMKVNEPMKKEEIPY